MKRPRDSKGRRIPRKELRRWENESRVAELTRFARDWCERNPPRVDPRVVMPSEVRGSGILGQEHVVLYDLNAPSPHPFQPVIEIPVEPRLSSADRFAASADGVDLRFAKRFRMRAVEWRLQQENTRVRWHTWEPVRPLPDDGQKAEEYRAARDVVGLVGIAISELRYVLGLRGHGDSHALEVLERLQLAARVWLGELPAVRDKPTEEDVQQMYEWWAYGSGRGHGEEKWR